MGLKGGSSQQPVIAQLIKQHNLSINILAGSLDHMRDVALGSLIIALPYSEVTLKIVIQHFKDHQVAANVLGYVAEAL